MLMDVENRFGFEGLVVPDCGTGNERIKGLATGQKIVKSFFGGKNERLLADAVKNGQYSEEILDLVDDEAITLVL